MCFYVGNNGLRTCSSGLEHATQNLLHMTEQLPEINVGNSIRFVLTFGIRNKAKFIA